MSNAYRWSPGTAISTLANIGLRPRFKMSTRLIPTAAAFAALFFAVSIFGQGTKDNEEDLVHFGDLIDVDVVGGFEFDWRGTLTPEGFLDGASSYGDPIYGLCRSESEIAAELTKSFSKFLREPKVIVRLIDRSNRAVVTLDGAVRSPQRFQLRRVAHLRELLVLSGGLTDEASGDIQIFRPKTLNCSARVQRASAGAEIDAGLKSNESQLINITIPDLLKGIEAADPIIQSGDLVTVLRAVPIYVIGGVNNPRPISARSNMTLTKAIASAGGFSKDADPSQVTVFRHSGSETNVIEVDLSKGLTGTVNDPELKALDIIDVGQKGKAKRKLAPIVAGTRFGRPGTLPLRILD